MKLLFIPKIELDFDKNMFMYSARLNNPATQAQRERTVS